MEVSPRLSTVVAGAAHGDDRAGPAPLEDALFARDRWLVFRDDHQIATDPQVIDRRRDDDAGVAEQGLLEDPVTSSLAHLPVFMQVQQELQGVICGPSPG